MEQVKWTMYLMIGLTLLLVVGCASIMTGTSQQVSFASDPSGAKVDIQPSGFQGTTPFTVDLKKGRGYIATARKEGYEKAVQSIGTTFNGWFIGNILLGGIIGMIVDLADGAYMNLDRDTVNFRLEPKKKGIEP